jgi:hypothetical protein
MKGSRSSGRVDEGKESESTSVIVYGEPTCVDLKDAIYRHPRGIDQPCSERRGHDLVNA